MAQIWPSFLLLVSATLHLACHHASCSASKFNNATDLQALLSSKSMLSDGSMTSWNNSIHFCEWPGITCGGGRHPQRVVSLVLGSLGLSGSISPAIDNLTFLRMMDLSNNQFHGSIPREIGHLIRLQYLNLSQNSIGGGIPTSLSSCSQLQEICLNDNMLTGEVPPALSSCSDLRHINLKNNSLTGHIPPLLTNLSSLSFLRMDYNQLSGSIPPTIGSLHSLFDLSFESNQLSGSIPPSIGKLSKLTKLGLDGNQLSGAIPSPLWNLSSLSHLTLSDNNLLGSLPLNVGQVLPLIEQFNLFNNQIHAHIPMSLANASHLACVEINFNRFTGTIPSNLGSLQNLEWINLAGNLLEAKEANGWCFFDNLTNCTNLQALQLDSNNLDGVLPHSITNLSTKLQLLSMGDNRISGTISTEIRNLVSLTSLDLGPNLLTGSIPASIGMLQNMHLLDLNDNNLFREVPSTLSNLTQLTDLFLYYNELSGIILASLGNCRNLNLLNLESNKLSGGIPKEILTITTLSRGLVLALNSLTGPIPSEVRSLRNLVILDVSMNKLSGEIPNSLGECQELEQLSFRCNSFHGSIPLSLSALRGIQDLDLSQNNLSGQIPDFLQDFRFLNYLNLSFNNFEGAVPRHGVFANTSAVSILGNNNLCGGNPELKLPACSSRFTKKKKKQNSYWLIMIISVVGSLLLFFLLFCFFVARCWMQKSRRKYLDSASNNGKERVSYAELVRATNGFSTDNLIGSGSFSRVYKGILHDDAIMKVVAVKVLNLQLEGAANSFTAECDALRNIRHRNLVKILTTCSSVDFRGNEFKALVLEFMTNGSLDDWLHPKEDEQSERGKLTLTQRLNIAIDVASALDYLHHYGETPVIHCDLKPSNVFLDDGMIAHVGDFGIARILEKVAGKSPQYSTSSLGLKGTIGYVPPEYGMENRVSTRGDVYSYGILLLEMFTGKSPTDGIFMEGLSLYKFVEMAFPQQVTDVIDAQLLSLKAEENTNDAKGMNDAKAIECIATVLQIGILCSNELPADRLEIGEVIKKLHQIRNIFLRNRTQVVEMKDEGPSIIVKY